MNINCLKCKGRYPEKYCGKTYCPLLTKINRINKDMKQIKKEVDKDEFSGQSPTIFVGRIGYPKVNLGIMGLTKREKNPEKRDNPKQWVKEKLTPEEIIKLRTQMINSRKKVQVKNFKSYTRDAQEIAMSKKAPDIEVELEDKPKFRIKTSFDISPNGPQGQLKKLKITSNTRIPKKIEKIYNDTDYKSVKAMNELYEKGISETKITRLLSAGTLGVKMNRKLVPTRWSITATDDALGKEIMKEIKHYPQIEKPKILFGGITGNYFLAIMFPNEWSYELFEMYSNENGNTIQKIQENEYTTNHEFFSGRKEYAEETAGGYYAARLAILEKLKQMKRQASVLLLRFITKEYYVPLGVWVVREAVRNAMKQQFLEFSDKKLAILYAQKKGEKSFNIDISQVINNSKLYEKIKKQKKLFEF